MAWHCVLSILYAHLAVASAYAEQVDGKMSLGLRLKSFSIYENLY